MDSNHDIVPTLRMFNGLMTNQAADEIEQLRRMLESANQVLRSSHMIASRSGRETNWEAFTKTCLTMLVEQAKYLYGNSNEVHAVLTARPYVVLTDEIPEPGPIEHASDAFAFPKDGITCFHCGETFTTPGSARTHFGGTPAAVAGCQIKVGAERGLLMALRKAEERLASYQADDIDVVVLMYKMQTRHADALQAAEELGYERGLQDGKLLPKE